MDRQLNRICSSFRSRLKLMLLTAGVSRIIVAALVLFALLLTVDWLVHLPTWIRLATLALYLAGVAGTLYWTLWSPLARAWNDPEVLSYVDSVLPDQRGSLLELYELTTQKQHIQETQSEVGAKLAAAAAANLEAVAAKVTLAQTLQRRRANSWLAGAGVLAVVLAALVVIPAGRTYVRIGAIRLFNPFSETRWPHKTTVDEVACKIGEKRELDPSKFAVPQLEPLTIEARVTGEVPDFVMLHYRTNSERKWQKVRLAVQDGKVSHPFDGVRDEIDFYLVGGDYDTKEFHIGVIQRPYLKNVVVAYDFPDYAGLPDRTERTSQLKGLEGTKVTVDFESSMNLTAAFLVPMKLVDGQMQVDESKQPIPLERRTPTQFQWRETLSRSGSYTVKLQEEHGFEQPREERLDVSVEEDKRPVVELLSPGRDQMQTNRATLDVAFRATDDFGLKQVEFVYCMDGGEVVVLTDRITGPIPQTGIDTGVHRFAWPLRKVELPASGTLECFVRVRDVNPNRANDPPIESARAQVKLLKPTEFQREILEKTKGLLAEGRLTWRNQLNAYRASEKWLAEGTGDVNDKLWLDMVEKQEKAFLAAKAMRGHLQVLTSAYEQNQMAQEFMSGRLNVVAQLITRLTDIEHVSIDEGLRSTRPQTAEEAAAAVLKKTRAQRLAVFGKNQKLATLVSERVLRKLYDWSDLQTCTVTTKLMIEQQEDVSTITADIAARYIGQNILDLSTADQDKLLTLGKQQRAVFESETGLESQITYLMYKAQRQGRLSIFAPLSAALSRLRDDRVNDHLKQAAQMIENNQPSQVLDDQKAAINALRLVESGLVMAGQKVDDDPEITVAMALADTGLDADDTKRPTTQPGGSGSQGPIDPTQIELPPITPPPPPPETLLANAVRNSIEWQDNVRARVDYLSKNNGPTEMPRFVRLKMLMLQERQGIAIGGLDEAIKIGKTVGSVACNETLAWDREEFGHYEKLLAAEDISGCHQQAQIDTIDTLKDLLQLLGWEKAVKDVADENRRNNGVDAFGRQYLLRDQTLETVVGLLADVSYAQLLQRDVVRKVSRFNNCPAAGKPLAEIEKANRARAAAAQKKLAALIAGVVSRSNGLSADVIDRVRETGVIGLAELKLDGYVAPIAAGGKDAGLVEPMTAAEQAMLAAMHNLRDLLEERVKPKVVEVVETQPEPVSAEDFAKLQSREHLAELIRKDTQLPAEVRARMIKALERKDFPAKYRDLLSAYYGSFVNQDKVQD